MPRSLSDDKPLRSGLHVIMLEKMRGVFGSVRGRLSHDRCAHHNTPLLFRSELPRPRGAEPQWQVLQQHDFSLHGRVGELLSVHGHGNRHCLVEEYPPGATMGCGQLSDVRPDKHKKRSAPGACSGKHADATCSVFLWLFHVKLCTGAKAGRYNR